MAAVTPTLVQHFNMPSTVDYGTGERRLVKIYIEVTSTATSNTLDVSTYVSGLSALVSIDAEMLDGAINGGTANTWSTTTLTMAGHAGSGVWVLVLTGYF